MSSTKILSIANAKPVGEISDTIHNVADVSLSSKNTWIKYKRDIIFTAKFPSIPAVCVKEKKICLSDGQLQRKISVLKVCAARGTYP